MFLIALDDMNRPLGVPGGDGWAMVPHFKLCGCSPIRILAEGFTTGVKQAFTSRDKGGVCGVNLQRGKKCEWG